MHRLRTHFAPLTSLPAGLWLVCWLCGAGLLLLTCGEELIAAVVDEVKEEEEIVIDDGFEIPESTFDQWVFGGAQNAAQGVSRLESHLKLRVEAIDRVCGLTDSQVAKLNLAGHGDIKRFLDDVDVVRKKFMRVRRNRKAWNKIWQDIQPLQIRMNAGLFNETSFFHKVLKRTLSDEQSSKQEQADWERRIFHYHAKLSLVVQMIERTMPLRSEQRKKLLEVLKRETQPPRAFGQYDYYVVLYQLAKIPNGKLKPILDDAQWKSLQLHTQQARGMEHWLKQQKILP